MKRTIWIWELWGFAFTSLFGTLLHFLYELLGNAVWIAPFSGVNESTWEHMKLLFWPMFIYAIFQGIFFKGYENFWCVKLCGTLLGLALIPTVFYMYNGIIGKSPDWVNITIFFVSAAVAYIYEALRLKNEAVNCSSPKLSFALLCLMGALFILFTFATPEIALFKDPIDGSYGI
jgi:hypothetical protein